MAEHVEGKWVVPNPQVPRTFGILNIVFSIILLLFGAYSIVMIVVGPKIQNAVISQMKDQQATRKAERDARIADLKKKEDAAKTKEDKESAKEEREAAEKDFEPDMTGFMSDAMGMASDPRIVAYSYTESIAGAILNVLLLVSGVGLLRLSEWGRRLALSVAWLKIVRWITVVVVSLVLIVPITAEKSQKMFQDMEKQMKAKTGGRASPMPMAAIGQFAAIAGAVATVVMAVFGSIYPVVSLWFLTRPAARAAVMARAKPAAPPEFAAGELS